MRCLQAPGTFLLSLLVIISFTVDVPTSLADAGDAINRTLSLRDGDTLVSGGGTFELGFFSLGGSSMNKYLAIRLRNIPVDNVVWVANRRAPIRDSTGVLKFSEAGNLTVEGKADGVVWKSSVGAAGVSNPVAQLLDTGNLVIRDGDRNGSSSDNYFWQSFEEPGNTLVAGMKLGVNLRTGRRLELTSWRSADDPFPGNYTFGLEPGLLPRLILRRGTAVIYSSGFWNGRQFSGIPDFMFSEVYGNVLVNNEDGEYYSFQLLGSNRTQSTVVVQPDGRARRLAWSARTSTWNDFLTGPEDRCDAFGICGPYSVCNASSTPICVCPRGFRPRSPEDWKIRYTSDGCVREAALQCGRGDGFVTLREVKLPDAKNMTVGIGVGLDECRDRCLGNCSCTAYAGTEVRNGTTGCLTWSGELVDVRTTGFNGGDVLYLRVPGHLADPTTVEEATENKSKRSKVTVVAATVVSVVVVLVLLCVCGIWIRKRKKATKLTATTADGDKRKHLNASMYIVGENAALPSLEFEAITKATDKFSPSNKVGEGGFGSVYKGVLDDGQEVAVKRLSWTSIQGTNEFINEVKLIAKLQHKNLVRLVGFCVYGEERMLIYEYMQNSGLDSFIFNENKRALLDWSTRSDIILGVAKGLMYLHHDSRYKIIHRDLKASNILLDGAMNPKISDFGTARIFGADQNMERTKRVIGTYGYMSPEYALNGTISVKSDVFSFGILTLEVLSGVRNRGIYMNESHWNLLTYAWKLWQEGNCLEFLDATVTSSFDTITQITRFIQIALLCVQEKAVDRPTMSTVVMMLSNENFPLPQPKRPGFLILSSGNVTAVSSPSKQEYTKNELTVTLVDGR